MEWEWGGVRKGDDGGRRQSAVSGCVLSVCLCAPGRCRPPDHSGDTYISDNEWPENDHDRVEKDDRPANHRLGCVKCLVPSVCRPRARGEEGEVGEELVPSYLACRWQRRSCAFMVECIPSEHMRKTESRASGKLSKLGNTSSPTSTASHAVDMPVTPSTLSLTSLQSYGTSSGPKVAQNDCSTG